MRRCQSDARSNRHARRSPGFKVKPRRKSLGPSCGASRALQAQELQCAIAGRNSQFFVEDFAGRAFAGDGLRIKDLQSLAVHFAPRAGPGRQPANRDNRVRARAWSSRCGLLPSRSSWHRSRPPAGCGFSTAVPRSTAASARAMRPAPRHRELVVQFAGGLARHRHFLGEQHRARVEAFVHLHDHHAGFRIARHDGPLDGRSAPPARQERAVQIEAAQLAAHRESALGRMSP